MAAFENENDPSHQCGDHSIDRFHVSACCGSAPGSSTEFNGGSARWEHLANTKLHYSPWITTTRTCSGTSVEPCADSPCWHITRFICASGETGICSCEEEALPLRSHNRLNNNPAFRRDYCFTNFLSLAELMMMSILVDMPMFQLFSGWLAQSNNLHIEMQLIAGQRMVEVQADSIAIDRFHTRIP